MGLFLLKVLDKVSADYFIKPFPDKKLNLFEVQIHNGHSQIGAKELVHFKTSDPYIFLKFLINSHISKQVDLFFL